MEERRVIKSKLILGFLVLYATICCPYASDTLSPNEIIRYNDTIVSLQETFELGFFSPGNSTKHYVGIWYKKISYRTVVWVANRNTPLTHTSVELTLTPQGVLSIRDTTTGNVLWASANSLSPLVSNPTGQLRDTGNFLIYDTNQNNPLWQSFDSPTNTLLPGMKLGRNLVTGDERRLTSWKSDDDPASGNFSYWIDTRGYPQLIITEGPDIINSRVGPWNGLTYTGYPRQNHIYNRTFVINQREIYYQYDLINNSVLMRVVVPPDGVMMRLLWADRKQEWSVYQLLKSDNCDQYALCGPNGMCNIDNSPICECLEGFEPTSPDHWRNSNWSQGCRRIIPLDCGPGEWFNKLSNLKLPDTEGSTYYSIMTLMECEKTCKSICSCTAYTHTNISGNGSGCLIWLGDQIDIRYFAENGDTLYIRMAAPGLDTRNSNVGIRVRVTVPVAFVVLVILASTCLFYRYKRMKQHQQGTPKNEFEHYPEHTNGDEDLELPLFGFATLLKATNNFSMNNKLGEGGYGPVYKAWGLHNEARSLELVANCLSESINIFQVLRSIHVGLLCVQRRPEDRPTMSSVILMLGSEGALPSPKEPGFYVGEGLQDTAYGDSSNNELTISMLDGR